MSASSNTINPWPFLLPALSLCLLFFLLPTLNMVILSLTTETGFGFDNFKLFFATPHLTQALYRSLILASSATIVASLVACPHAYFIVFCVHKKWRPLFLLAILAPFWTSFTIRAFSWQLVLSDNGVVTWFIELVTGFSVTLGILYTMNASIFGLALFGSMLTTFTLYGALVSIDHKLIEAASTLGAKPFHIFKDIILPLGLPGWLAGIFLTFIVCVGDYAVPTLLGGGLKPVLAQIMLSILKGTYDLSQAATIAIVLAMTVIICGLPIILYGFAKRRRFAA
ncbi:MAG: ABC transporter permease subunit [Alphaproteobacteria bacterium]|nr:ABC transporter permease subunit [Alphaproteobacteria bacterium]